MTVIKPDDLRIHAKLPDLDGLRVFVNKEVLYDDLVKKSIDDGFMTVEELVIGRWVYKYLDLHEPKNDKDVESEEQYEIWLLKLPEACLAAAQQFGILEQEVKELFEKSLEIRNRNIPRKPSED